MAAPISPASHRVRQGRKVSRGPLARKGSKALKDHRVFRDQLAPKGLRVRLDQLDRKDRKGSKGSKGSRETQARKDHRGLPEWGCLNWSTKAQVQAMGR